MISSALQKTLMMSQSKRPGKLHTKRLPLSLKADAQGDRQAVQHNAIRPNRQVLNEVKSTIVIFGMSILLRIFRSGEKVYRMPYSSQ